MRIGILQTGHTPDALQAENGSYPDMFAHLLRGHDFEFRAFAVVDMEFPASIHDADGWLITGSRHGAYEDHPFIAPLEAFIRDVYGAGVPMVGICFGHQIIAQALGGKVEKYAGGWAVGPQDYTINGTHYALNAWHQDQVTKPPEGAQVIGGNDFCRYAALAYDDRALSVQPHPEHSAQFIDGLIRTRGRGVVPDPLLDRAAAALDTDTDEAAMADMISDFFLKPRKVPHG